MHYSSDLSSYLASARSTKHLKAAVDGLIEPATTGIVSEKAKHLAGQTLSLSLLDRKSALLQQYSKNIVEANIIFDATQGVMEDIKKLNEGFLQAVSLSSQLSSSGQLENLSQKAVQSFYRMISVLNTEVGGRSIFSGSRSKSTPLPDGRQIIGELTSITTGMAEASDISDAIDMYFDSPSGTYQSIHYNGSTNSQTQFLTGIDARVTLEISAVDSTITEVLKGLAKTVISLDTEPVLDSLNRNILLSESRRNSIRANDFIIEKQSTIGLSQSFLAEGKEKIQEALRRNTSRKANMLSIDRYRHVSEIEEISQKLELSLHIIARRGQVSLATYLRQ